MVPKELTICQILLERQDDILGHVITDDETWVYQYDPEMKRQSAQWETVNSPQPKKILLFQMKSQNNVADFFYIRGIVHYEFVPTGQTVNHVYYLEVLGRLCEKVGRKQPELFASNSWILHHDNAPAHTALSVRETLATLSTLKETTVVFSNEVYSTFTTMSSQTLSDHVCILLMINFDSKSYCLVCPDSQ